MHESGLRETREPPAMPRTQKLARPPSLMKMRTFPLAAVACLLAAGCSTPDINPQVPRADTGYVDFYTDTNQGLTWQVKRASESGVEMRTVFCEYKPLPANILRLAAPPGAYRFEVWFMNQVTTGPQTVLVQVENSKVTPVHVTLTAAGETSIDTKEYGFHGSAKRYGRGTKIRTEESQAFQIGTVPGNALAYQPKERMPYFSQAPK